MDKNREKLPSTPNEIANAWQDVLPDESYEEHLEKAEKAQAKAEYLAQAKAFDEYLNAPEKPDEVLDIAERSPEVSKFIPVRPERKDDQGNHLSKTAHYICPGLFGPDNSYFEELTESVKEDDVYKLDRTSDFSMEHALNGIIEDIQQSGKDYKRVEIVTISIAGAPMGQAIEAKEQQYKELFDQKGVSITYVDPFDTDFFALGGATQDSAFGKISRAGMRFLGKAALIAAHPFRDIVLKEGALGGAVQEPTSVGFIADQLGTLGNSHIFNEQTGKIHAANRVDGILQTGPKSNEVANRDEFLDTEKLQAQLKESGMSPINKRGTHGMIGDGDFAPNSDNGELTPTQAYVKIQAEHSIDAQDDENADSNQRQTPEA